MTEHRPRGGADDEAARRAGGKRAAESSVMLPGRRSPTRSRAIGRPTRGGLGVVLLHALLILFAADAERGLRTRFEALDRDFFAALFTDAEAAVLDLPKGLLDLVEEYLLTATEAEGEGL